MARPVPDRDGSGGGMDPSDPGKQRTCSGISRKVPDRVRIRTSFAPGLKPGIRSPGFTGLKPGAPTECRVPHPSPAFGERVGISIPRVERLDGSRIGMKVLENGYGSLVVLRNKGLTPGRPASPALVSGSEHGWCPAGQCPVPSLEPAPPAVSGSRPSASSGSRPIRRVRDHDRLGLGYWICVVC